MNFVVKQMVGNQFKDMTEGLGGGNEGTAEQQGEDPEVVAARLEQEERRKEKHRKMEAEREKMRGNIRNKYNIHKKEENMPLDFGTDGRIGAARKKTPEELAAEMQAEEDSIIGQLGLTEQVEKAKTAVNTALDTVKGFLPFGK